MTHRSHLPHRPPSRRAALVALTAVAAAVLLGACSDDGADVPRQVAISVEQTAPGTAPPPTMPTDCVDAAPGDILSAAEADVRFSTESVCPGYVTVTVGTPVTWTNTTDTSYDVEVLTQDPDGTLGDLPFFARTIPPFGAVDYTFTEAGTYAYRIDALEAFRGTIEVLPPEGFGDGDEV